MVNDVQGDAPAAVLAVASLGSWGTSSANAERDMHRWLKDSFGMTVEPIFVKMKLECPTSLSLIDVDVPFLPISEMLDYMANRGLQGAANHISIKSDGSYPHPGA